MAMLEIVVVVVIVLGHGLPVSGLAQRVDGRETTSRRFSLEWCGCKMAMSLWVIMAFMSFTAGVWMPAES